MAKLQCDTCGVLDHVLFDGYAFGDTLLEGVMFEARLTGQTDVETGSPMFDVKVAAGHEAHWNKLNQKYWLGRRARHRPRHRRVPDLPRRGRDAGLRERR